MHRRLIGLWAALLALCVTPLLHAQKRPGIALTIDVSHVATDTWRIDYRFSRPVNATVVR